MTTTENFDLDAFQQEFGRLPIKVPKTPLRTIKITPGSPAKGQNAWNEALGVIYPRAMLVEKTPDSKSVPYDALPLKFNPTFQWASAVNTWQAVKMIQEGNPVYDENDETGEKVERDYHRLIAAYLLNQIDPNLVVTIIGKSAPEPESTVADFFDQLLSDEDDKTEFGIDDDPFCCKDWGDFDTSFDDPFAERAETDRKISARQWLDEQVAAAECHATYMANANIIGRRLLDRLLPDSYDLSEFYALMHPELRAVARKAARGARRNADIAHHGIFSYLGDLAEGTDAERMDLFSQYVTAKSVEEFRPTLGPRLISGFAVGTVPTNIRRTRYALHMISVLLDRGFATPDLERRIIEITPAGQEVIGILRRCPSVTYFNAVMVDECLGKADPEEVAGLTDWVINFFRVLKDVLAELED